MTTKQCSTCKFWDKETEWVEFCNNRLTNHCLAPLPASIYKSYRDTVVDSEGQDCPVYKEKNDNNCVP